MENNKRPTKEVEIGGHKIVLKTYATGREFNEIQSVYLRSAKVNMVGSTPQMAGFTAEVSLEADKKGLEMIVVSVDGKTEFNEEGKVTKLADFILDLPADIYQQVMSAVNEVLKKN